MNPGFTCCSTDSFPLFSSLSARMTQACGCACCVCGLPGLSGCRWHKQFIESVHASGTQPRACACVFLAVAYLSNDLTVVLWIRCARVLAAHMQGRSPVARSQPRSRRRDFYASGQKTTRRGSTPCSLPETSPAAAFRLPFLSRVLGMHRRLHTDKW